MAERRHRRRWEPREVDTVRNLWPFLTAQELAPILDRAPAGVYCLAQRLGLCEAHKHPEYWARIKQAQRTRASNDPRLLATRWTPGQVPANKGQPMPEHVRAKCARTFFRKGNLNGKAQALYKPVGTTRIDSDGLLSRKVTDAGRGGQRWRSVHRLVWEAANGPIPAGHIVVFKPGMRTAVEREITLDRLECISHEENMARNTVHRLPQALAAVVLLRSAVTRQINRRSAQRRGTLNEDHT